MEQFKGFPSKMRFTAVPDFFLNRLLPQISDIQADVPGTAIFKEEC